MKLANLNALISKKINESDLTKTEMAQELDMPISTFCYKVENGQLNWPDIAKLKKIGLHFSLKEFSDAMSKDLNQKVIVRRPRA